MISANDIDGIAPYLKTSGYCQLGWIYRRSTDGVCRNHLGKRVSPVTGNINVGYNHQIITMNQFAEAETNSN